MAKRKKIPKYRIYLAGPIHGCNEEQKTRWRRVIISRWGDEFEFIDPTEKLVPEDNKVDDAAFEVISNDEAAIKSSDAVLANMWKESIGTAIGVAVACREGKPVVVVDKNHLRNRALAYYSDAVCESEIDAIRHLKAILRQQEQIKYVVKKKGAEEEEFSREKMAKSIRQACNAASQDDLIATSKIVPAVLERLLEGRRVSEGKVSSTDIRSAIWDVLADLESDPLRSEHFAGIRSAWEAFEAKTKDGPMEALFSSLPLEQTISDEPLNVPVETGKSHTSIWNKNIKSLKDIPTTARPLFDEICRVQGIQRIRLGRMSEGARVDKCVAELFASRQEYIIEGKCYDHGEKGRVQAFQVIVSDPKSKEQVRQSLMLHLGSKGMLKFKEEDR